MVERGGRVAADVWSDAGASASVKPTDTSGHIVEADSKEPMTLFRGDTYIRCLPSSSSLSWPFALTYQPCELSQSPSTHLHHWFIIFVRLGVNPSALLDWLHPEALGDCVSLWVSLVTLDGYRHLDVLVARIIARRLVFVSGSDHSDCEGFLTFPWWRAKIYSNGLLVACVILILCWLCGTLFRVWRVMPISTWTFKWVNRHNDD
jgi:hypothetical protein